jgi:acyl carrier protein
VSARTEGAIAQQLAEFVNREIMAPGHAIGPDDLLEPAGVDSMALLKVLLYIEREFGFWIPDEDLVDDTVASTASLARYVAGRLPAG